MNWKAPHEVKTFGLYLMHRIDDPHDQPYTIDWYLVKIFQGPEGHCYIYYEQDNLVQHVNTLDEEVRFLGPLEHEQIELISTFLEGLGGVMV